MNTMLYSIGIIIMAVGFFAGFYLGNYFGTPDPEYVKKALEFPAIYPISNAPRSFNYFVMISTWISTFLSGIVYLALHKILVILERFKNPSSSTQKNDIPSIALTCPKCGKTYPQYHDKCDDCNVDLIYKDAEVESAQV